MSKMKLIAIIKEDGFELDFKSTGLKKEGQSNRLEEYIYSIYEEDKYKALYHLGIDDTGEQLSPSLSFLQNITKAFLEAVARWQGIEELRENAIITLGADKTALLLEEAPYMMGQEYLKTSWVEGIITRLGEVFRNEIKSYKGSVSEYFASQKASIHIVGRVYFHLVESKKEEYPFAFLATYLEKVEGETKARHIPLKQALVHYKGDSEKLLNLLATVNKAATKSKWIREIMESGEIFHPIGLYAKEAYTFLQEVPIYEASGILCRIPNWWKQKSSSLSLSVNIGDRTPSKVGEEALMDFDFQLALGGEQITEEEIKSLLNASEGLALLKGKWVEINHKKLEQVLEAFEEAKKFTQEDMTLVEAIKVQLTKEKLLDSLQGVCEVEVSHGEWLAHTLKQMHKPELIEEVPLGEAFKANLRHYQKTGLSWLCYMKELGLGACLADDMGLGKTVQVIALLQALKQSQGAKTLLVVPASLMGNWERELTTFAPRIKYYILHPTKTGKSSKEAWENEQLEATYSAYDVIITTYSMLLKCEWLTYKNWDLLILDEAQAIKNAGTKQSKVTKTLKAKFKIAMTGTPIENSLSDLWSLFDFLNPGLLGTTKEFKAFTKQLKDNPVYNSRLKDVVSPFILRRLKTDKSVISDLPEKIELKTFATLSKKQAILYRQLLKSLETKLATSEGIERKGLILASLMKFKQICNHPDQYLGDGGYNATESGKYDRLREICETIYEKRERVLVFTQFKEMTEPLSQFLESIFEHKGLVLHGGTAVAKRQELVDKFQGEAYVPFMVLSLKAGGVGLNLTAANHVIHFDRWWNPAIENQATDRAFRIGQQKNVLVHKFVTQGTIEEKIDEMIESKKSLAQSIIAETKENWITELDNDEILSLFSLSI